MAKKVMEEEQAPTATVSDDGPTGGDYVPVLRNQPSAGDQFSIGNETREPGMPREMITVNEHDWPLKMRMKNDRQVKQATRFFMSQSAIHGRIDTEGGMFLLLSLQTAIGGQAREDAIRMQAAEGGGKVTLAERLTGRRRSPEGRGNPNE